jgi:hypothetical protein
MYIYSPKKPKKFKETMSAGKLMATVLNGRKGIIVELLQQGTTMLEVYR